jgi:hypothetical protein
MPAHLLINMPIKYGDLTIIYNKEQITVFSSLLTWLQYEYSPPTDSKYVFLFDDGEICEANDKTTDYKFKFVTGVSSAMPIYFEKTLNVKDHRTFFYKRPTENANNKRSLNFTNLFGSYSKYRIKDVIASIYNSIYYCRKDLSIPEIFGIIRTQSNDYMPRFQFAYDDDYFSKDEIVYLIHCIFSNGNLRG